MRIHAHGTGFTVLELLVVMAIAAVLLILGIPSLQQFTQRQHMKAAIGGLHNDLLLARSEAVLGSREVVACPGTPGSGCSDSLDWSAGWIVFADGNGDRQRQAEEPLLRHGQLFERVRVTGSRGRRYVRFYPDGSAPGSNGSLLFCGGGGPMAARKLVVSNIGRIRRDEASDIDASLCPSA